MTKTEAINLLGGTPGEVAKALGITRAAISNWPDPLPQSIADRVVGAHTRLKRKGVFNRVYTGKPVRVR